MATKASRRAAHLITLSVAIAGCSANATDPPGAIEQAGTASQDVEVRKLRTAFAWARSDAGYIYKYASSGDVWRAPFSPAVGYQIASDLPVKNSRPRRWSCIERSAKKDSPQAAKSVTYVFDATDASSMTNTGSGFGKVFVFADNVGGDEYHSSLVTGVPGTNVAGALVTEEVLRFTMRDEQSSSSGEVLARSKLIIERVTRAAVQRLSPADQATFDGLAAEHETAVSAGDLAASFGSLERPAVALAYVYCETFAD